MGVSKEGSSSDETPSSQPFQVFCPILRAFVPNCRAILLDNLGNQSIDCQRMMPDVPIDRDREHRIDCEVIVDCYDETEVTLGWYY